MESLEFDRLSRVGAAPIERPWEVPAFELRVPCSAPLHSGGGGLIQTDGILTLPISGPFGRFFTRAADEKKMAWRERMRLPGHILGLSLCAAVLGFGVQFVVFSDFSFSEGVDGPLFRYPALLAGLPLSCILIMAALWATDAEARAAARVDLPLDLVDLLSAYRDIIAAAQAGKTDEVQQRLDDRIKFVVETSLEQLANPFTGSVGGILVDTASDVRRQQEIKAALDAVGRLMIAEVAAEHQRRAG